MTVFVGTSGWAYKEWKPDVYPPGVPQKRWLEHYSTMLGACEINATFYRIQQPDTFARWASSTPESFRFSTKAHRALTHSKSLRPEGNRASLLADFLGSVSRLGSRLGAVLFQLPAYRQRDDDELKAFLGALPRSQPYAFEFRDDSWLVPAVADFLAASNSTVCISETEGAVPESLPPGPIAYVRMRHDRYSPEARGRWAELLAREGASRDVFAFLKHEGIPATDSLGGVGMARWLTDHG